MTCFAEREICCTVVTSVAISEPQVVPRSIPWEDKAHGVVSLYEMLRFYADFFTKSVCEMYRMEAKWPSTDTLIPEPAAVAAALVGLEMDCLQYGLTETAKKCARIKSDCHTRRVTYREIVSALRELRERLEDELQSELFLHLDPKQALLYQKPLDGWEPVLARFSRVRHDVEESTKCFALERYAASLFHVLLIAEYGVIELATIFGVQGDRPGWGALERLKKIHEKKHGEKSPLEQQRAALLANVLPLAFAMKDSWRHKISHVDNKLEWMDTDFSPEVAAEIISATRGFMRRLASELP